MSMFTFPVPALAEEGESANLAFGKTVTAAPFMGASEDELARVTDGVIDKDPMGTMAFRYHTGSETENTENKPWIQIDLGQNYEIDRINYVGVIPGDYPEYYSVSHNMVFQVSEDENFEDETTKTVFNSDAGNFFGFGEGVDSDKDCTAEGQMISFEPTTARYVRYYQHGMSQLPTPGANFAPNALAATEIEVYGTDYNPPELFVPEGNLAYNAVVTGSEINTTGADTGGWYGGYGSNDLQEITSGASAGDDHWKSANNNPGGENGESVFVQLDMRKTVTLTTVQFWNKCTPAGYNWTYWNKIIQLSEDGQNWKNVYNSDAENKAGQDPSDSGKLVCGGRLQNGTITGVEAGHDEMYEETADGMTVSFEPTKVRYIRWWTSGTADGPGSTFLKLYAFNRNQVVFDYNDGTGKTGNPLS